MPSALSWRIVLVMVVWKHQHQGTAAPHLVARRQVSGRGRYRGDQVHIGAKGMPRRQPHQTVGEKGSAALFAAPALPSRYPIILGQELEQSALHMAHSIRSRTEVTRVAGSRRRGYQPDGSIIRGEDIKMDMASVV